MNAEMFKQCRLSIQETQESLAEKLGVSKDSVSRMERGKIPICKRTELAMMYLQKSTAGSTEEAIKGLISTFEPITSRLEEVARYSKKPAERKAFEAASKEIKVHLMRIERHLKNSAENTHL